MSVQDCQEGDKPGFKWGILGKCFLYEESDQESKDRARQNAVEQGRAIEADKTNT